MKRFFCILCAVSLCVAMAGCEIGDKPETPVSGFCAAMQTFDLGAMNDYLEVEDTSIDTLLDNMDGIYESVMEVMAQYSQGMTYTITDTQKEGDSATVSVSFDYVDISVLFGQTMETYVQEIISSLGSDLSEEEMVERFMEILKETSQSDETEKSTITADFTCVKTEKGWKISHVPGEVLTVLTGNLGNVGY